MRRLIHILEFMVHILSVAGLVQKTNIHVFHIGPIQVIVCKNVSAMKVLVVKDPNVKVIQCMVLTLLVQFQTMINQIPDTTKLVQNLKITSRLSHILQRKLFHSTPMRNTTILIDQRNVI